MKKHVSVRIKKRRRFLKAVCVAVASVILITAVLEAGVFLSHLSAPWTPDYEKEEISSILAKEELSEEDYRKLYMQTGLSALSVDALRKKGEQQTILKIQQDFFSGSKLKTEQFAPFTCYHYLDQAITTAPLEAGDIIVTPTTHFSFFTLGHAALVTGSNTQEIINATGYSSKSGIESLSEVTCRPAFVILRPRAGKTAAEKAVNYALENLSDLPYSISLGLIGKKYSDKADRTNCGHIIWYAYKQAGIDLDSTGGLFVLPRDIALSPELELVQVYGMDPQNIYK